MYNSDDELRTGLEQNEDWIEFREFDPSIPEEGPSAPPPGWLDSVEGYGDPKDDDCTDQICPLPADFVPHPEHDRNASVPNVKYAQLCTPHYRLETFTESRSSSWEHEIYNGQVVDGPQYGVAPPPWLVEVQYPTKFTDTVQKVHVPHTSSVKTPVIKYCPSPACRCTWCHSSGHKTCRKCNGNKKLLHFIELKITWKNQVYEFIPDRQLEFPMKKFEKVSGEVFFTDESILVFIHSFVHSFFLKL
ncbi:hypothetical protein P4O66_006247 [Electrophorus voltai]|uniref:Uncharacterized protein n=1 Tax=Electrophorus voltai TaxID=2609070 RepID=A0AAD8ZIU7_9TELE|nr:hypothetical protein P4O66_006247 [Electrophorus voltai]